MQVAGGGRVLRARETGPRWWTIQSKRHCTWKCRRHTEKCLFIWSLGTSSYSTDFKAKCTSKITTLNFHLSSEQISVYYLQYGKKSLLKPYGRAFLRCLKWARQNCSMSFIMNFRYVKHNYLYFLKGFFALFPGFIIHNVFFISALSCCFLLSY